MPRGPRLDAPGILHHVMVRGIGRAAIFLDDADREDFLSRLDELCADGAATVYAWCLMGNHLHLAIRAGGRPLATTMRRLLTGYAMGFNRRHGRVGHLFQNRYKSVVVEEERYFLALVRYIHRNPLRAGLVATVDELAKYPWSGHAALVGGPSRGFQEAGFVLSRFGTGAGEARRELRDFMGAAAQASAEEGAFKGGGLKRSRGLNARRDAPRSSARDDARTAYDERILGSGSFVEAMLENAAAKTQDQPAAQMEKERCFTRLVAEVAEKFDMNEEEVTCGGRRREVVRAREAIAFIGRNRIGLPATQIATALGVSQPAVVKAAERGRLLLATMRWEPSLK